MKASKVTDAQKAFILRQAEDGVRIGDICRKAGISQATFYSWRKKYAGMTLPEMFRLKAIEDEGARLKNLVVELSLDREMLQGVVRRKLVRQCRSDHWRSIGSPCPEAEAGGRGSSRGGYPSAGPAPC